MTTRTLSFTYAGLTVGSGQSDSNYTLTGVYRFNETYTKASLSFEVAINASTVSSFLTSEEALITAFTKIDQPLTVVLNSTTRHTYSPTAGASGNTGFNHRPTIQKDDDWPATSDRSALYVCSVECDLPADLSGRGGRLDSSVDVTTLPSGRKEVTISGVYTALSNNDARAQFAAEFTTYASAALDSVIGSGLWEATGTPRATTDDQDKFLTFTATYQEIKRNQASGTLNNTAIVMPSLRIQRSIPSTQAATAFAQFGAGDIQPPDTLVADYSCTVLFSETTDLDQLWISTLRQHVLDEIVTMTGVSVLAVIEEQRDFDPVENRLIARITCNANVGGQFWQGQAEWQQSENKGIVLRPVWDGNPFARDAYQGIASHTLRLSYYTLGPVETMQTELKTGFPIVQHPEPPEIENFVYVRTSSSVRERSIGIAGAEIPVFVCTTNYHYVRADKPKSRGELGGSTDQNTTRTRQGYSGV